jgi:hypothetical protein
MNHQNESEISEQTTLTFEEFGNEPFLKISHHNQMRPFFMSIVSDSDHWMFISSNGGLTAGRKNAEYAIFPYYTDDKITEFADITGNKSIFQIITDGKKVIWEPFSVRKSPSQKTEQNLYKSIYGNKIIFEEILSDYQLTFRYSWSSSDAFGFVKSSVLINQSDKDLNITLLDGIQNIMPCGVSSDLQRASSNLVDAYKRSELHKSSGLGIFALSAVIVDKAEPSEALKANVVWSVGLHDVAYLLSSLQLDSFRKGEEVREETDIKGEKGAYFISKKILLEKGKNLSWDIIADVNKNHSQVIQLTEEIQSNPDLTNIIEKDIRKGTRNLKLLVASADGLQHTRDTLQDSRNYSNVLFNIMRGGIFDNGYWIDKNDFEQYIRRANREVYEKHQNFFVSLESNFRHTTLSEKVQATGDADLIRLSTEYLPLKFSRRHGDPSRPWNKFSINLRDEHTGEKILDYEGNWRDIFQNWEALAYSYPGYIDGMICKFVNASTFDGYNPYRVTKDGFDWETIEPDDPWSYIGYWGDHQIIYLQKFLEIIEKFNPGGLSSYFDKDLFVYAGVPYIIKPYEEIVKNPKDTIDFDATKDHIIRNKRESLGGDGALLRDNDDSIYHVNLVEKLLVTLLAKLSNFIPEGGIWLNTQRPEWNDANNALVGNGVSMVTLYYMRRFLVFLEKTFENTKLEHIKLSNELVEFYHSVRETLETHHNLLEGSIDDQHRKIILDQLGKAASDYRSQIYKSGFWGKKRTASLNGLKRFIRLSIDFTEHSIRCNQRQDGLYHAYNLMTYSDEGVSITHLDEMLEGQVAVLSSGYLTGANSLAVLDAMKKSALFRPDQYSYILYPNKNLPGFLQKNIIPAEEVHKSAFIKKMTDNHDTSIVEKDIKGLYHFNGNFKNAGDLKNALQKFEHTEDAQLVRNETPLLLEMYEKVFHHKAFTGRSGTFYGYEGLGSIYWHMVSKLLLAVQEAALHSVEKGESAETTGRLLEHYYEIQAGIGVHKSPMLYGAFPTDPYSHTPMHRGAQQPGMTGQVKEDLLTRWGELGVVVENGRLLFRPVLLRASEFVSEPKTVVYTDLNGTEKTIHLQNNQLFFTYCQVPVIYKLSDDHKTDITYSSGKHIQYDGTSLNQTDSISIFERTGEIEKIEVCISRNILK